MPSSRTSSTSSVNSSTSSTTPDLAINTQQATSKDLSLTARSILTSLYNDRNPEAVTEHISPSSVSIQHEDHAPIVIESRDTYSHFWTQHISTLPEELEIEIKEACVDESQRKVWVRSEIRGLPNGTRKESIDMMSFDEEGLLSSTIGSQRVIRRRRASSVAVSRADDEDEDDY